MFDSCRLCHHPTNLWQDFCDACALAVPKPLLRGIPGGRRDPRRDGQRKRKRTLKLTLVRT